MDSSWDREHISDVEFNTYYNELIQYCSRLNLDFSYVNLVLHNYIRKGAHDYMYFLIHESLSANISIAGYCYERLMRIIFVGNIISYCGDIKGIKLSKSDVKLLYEKVTKYIKQNNIDLFNLSRSEELSVAFGVLTQATGGRDTIKYDDCLAILINLVNNSCVQKMVLEHYCTGNQSTDKYILYTVNFILKGLVSGTNKLIIADNESIALFAVSAAQVIRLREQQLDRILEQDEVDKIITSLIDWKATTKPGEVLAWEDVEKFTSALSNSAGYCSNIRAKINVDEAVIDRSIVDQLCRGLIHSTDVNTIKRKLYDFWEHTGGVKYSVRSDIELISKIYRLVLDFVPLKNKDDVYDKIISLILG